MAHGKLYMIPITLGDSQVSNVIPATIAELVMEIEYYIVENIRTVRRYLKKLSPDIDIDKLNFSVLNKHTKPEELQQFLAPAKQGHNIGVISEAGCPGVADPGADVVAIAHNSGIQVVPLVGPSSIILSLMASGMNGQNFAFVGYLPVKPIDRQKVIRQLEGRSRAENQTQIFIETPYRNNAMVEDIVKTCSDSTKLCVACDITLEGEYVKTQNCAAWKKAKVDLHKRPCIFLLHATNTGKRR